MILFISQKNAVVLKNVEEKKEKGKIAKEEEKKKLWKNWQ